MALAQKTIDWQVAAVNELARADLPRGRFETGPLHAITGRARKCGPAAISAVTGVPTHEAAAAIRRHNGGKPVNGTRLLHLGQALADLGFSARPDGSVYPGRLTMSQWVRRVPANGLWVLWVGGYRRSHYVAVEVFTSIHGHTRTRWADSVNRSPIGAWTSSSGHGGVPTTRFFGPRRRVVCALHVRRTEAR